MYRRIAHETHSAFALVYKSRRYRVEEQKSTQRSAAGLV